MRWLNLLAPLAMRPAWQVRLLQEELGTTTLTRASVGWRQTAAGALQSVASDGARFDYEAGNLRGLLLEAAATNQVLRSEDIADVAWSLTTGSTVQSNVTITNAPDGTTNADKLQEDATTGQHLRGAATNLPPNQLVAYSVYLKAAERNAVRLLLANHGASTNTCSAYFDLVGAGTARNVQVAGNGSNASAVITALGDGWYRCVLLGQPDTAGTQTRAQMMLVSSGTTISYAGTAGSGVYAWGNQLEAGGFATSYQPTVASTATRAQDAVIASLPAAHVSSRGTFWVEAELPNLNGNTANRSLFTLWGDANNHLRLLAQGNNLIVRVTEAGSAVVNDSVAVTLPQTCRMAIAYDNGLYRRVINGGAVTSSSGTGLSPQTNYQLGHFNSTEPLQGWLRRVQYFPLALSGRQLQLLTR